jgi:alpha-ribazole phosphatase
LAAIYSSDLQRALRTASIVASVQHLLVQTDPGLREISFGAFEGKTFAEIQRAYPDTVQAWLEDMSSLCPPGGETLQDVIKRADDVVHRLQNAHSGETILLVAHGGTVRALLCACLGWDPHHFWRWRVDNASLTVLENGHSGWRLALLNETCHLDGMR